MIYYKKPKWFKDVKWNKFFAATLCKIGIHKEKCWNGEWFPHADCAWCKINLW